MDRSSGQKQAQPDHGLVQSLAVTDPTHILRIIGEACAHQQPAMLLSMVTCSQARFVTLSESYVSMEAFIFSGDPELVRGAACGVGFNHLGHPQFFLSAVAELPPRPSDEPCPVQLAVPAQIAIVELRSSFRVPIFRDSDLSAQLRKSDGSAWAAQPFDISLGGIRLDFSPTKDPSLNIGETASLNLQMEGQVLEVEAIVRHRLGGSYGFLFPRTYHEGEPAPPQSLVVFVRELERRWLRRRAR